MTRTYTTEFICRGNPDERYEITVSVTDKEEPIAYYKRHKAIEKTRRKFQREHGELSLLRFETRTFNTKTGGKF